MTVAARPTPIHGQARRRSGALRPRARTDGAGDTHGPNGNGAGIAAGPTVVRPYAAAFRSGVRRRSFVAECPLARTSFAGMPHSALRPVRSGVGSRQAFGSAPGELLLWPGGSKSWDRLRSTDLRISVPKQSLPRVTWGLDGSSSDDCLPLAASAVRLPVRSNLAVLPNLPAGFPILLAGIAAAPIRLCFSVQFQKVSSETCGLALPFRHLKAAPANRVAQGESGDFFRLAANWGGQAGGLIGDEVWRDSVGPFEMRLRLRPLRLSKARLEGLPIPRREEPEESNDPAPPGGATGAR